MSEETTNGWRDISSAPGRDVRRYLEARSMTDRETRLSPAQAITALLLLAAACGATALGFASILGGFLP